MYIPFLILVYFNFLEISWFLFYHLFKLHLIRHKIIGVTYRNRNLTNDQPSSQKNGIEKRSLVLIKSNPYVKVGGFRLQFVYILTPSFKYRLEVCSPVCREGGPVTGPSGSWTCSLFWDGYQNVMEALLWPPSVSSLPIHSTDPREDEDPWCVWVVVPRQ